MAAIDTSASATPAVNLAKIDAIVAVVGRESRHAIPILQAIQNEFGYLPREAMERVCEISDITPASIMGIATFYSQFRLRPAGKHTIRVCHGTACHVKGAPAISASIRHHLNIPKEDDTDPNRIFTVQEVACLGCCTLAPCMQIGGTTYGHLTPETAAKAVEDFLKHPQSATNLTEQSGDTPPDKAEIRVGLGSCCVSRGSANVYAEAERVVKESGINARVKKVGCVGMCHQTPIMEIVKPGEEPKMYTRVSPLEVRSLLFEVFKPRGIISSIRESASKAIDNLLYPDHNPHAERYPINVRDPEIHAFLNPQKHIVLENCGHLDPIDMDEAIASDTFKALHHCLNDLEPENIIEEITASGLRGRGGAGFPTGRKWDFVRKAKGELKYIICNGDEGDPGAFMDRMLLESYPYRIIEGMAIAAFAVGASYGVLYIREEYPLALKRIRKAIEACEKNGYLGDNILGTGFSIHLKIMEGAGAFVCGEETALIASIEGKRGTPRLRPPYPAEAGLWGCPTLVNNVETYATVAWIIRNSSTTFSENGTGSSSGTKVFALAGKIKRGGLIEVPMGITLRQVVDEIGGGVPDGRKLKAVQVGGPSGGCVPAALSDTPIDYEHLGKLGSIMGSGGLVVLDDSDCMVEISRYFLQFTQRESCGRCTFCRVGTRRMLDILDRLVEGNGKKGDIEILEELAHQIKKGSLCGLGQTAPNPVLSTIRHFREEYEAHINGKCPAGKCPALISYHITDKCIGCTICARNCPVEAIKARPYEVHEIDQEKCVRCGGCKNCCPEDAVEVI
ncbi:MAG: NAD(P)H-dependent oxidoreductase subunit E [Planctomycetes bacterium]|nr:NAD(P)H-dependent oxidoreductase subunit E [Planctomycetota bacterium]